MWQLWFKGFTENSYQDNRFRITQQMCNIFLKQVDLFFLGRVFYKQHINMASDLDGSVIKRTQDSLGKYVKKPHLTEKLLKKPPFGFLHDVFRVVRINSIKNS